MEEHHANFEYCSAGLHVNPKFPHLGASLNDIISCDCCGKGLIEIKCPYTFRYMHPQNVPDSSFYLIKMSVVNFICLWTMIIISRYRVNLLQCICDLEHSDFVCWILCGMHCVADSDHFLKHVQPSSDNFFLLVLLPQLLTGSVRLINDSTVAKPMEDFSPYTYCWCSGKDGGLR